MTSDIDEGPFSSQNLVWDKYREAEFFLRCLELVQEFGEEVSGEFEEENFFRYFLSAFSNSAYAIDQYFDEVEDRDCLFSDSECHQLHQFVVEELRHPTTHIGKADGQNHDVADVIGRRSTYFLTEREYRFEVEDIPDDAVELLELEAANSTGSVPVKDLIHVYLERLEAELQQWDPAPESFGITAVTETWEE